MPAAATPGGACQRCQASGSYPDPAAWAAAWSHPIPTSGERCAHLVGLGWLPLLSLLAKPAPLADGGALWRRQRLHLPPIREGTEQRKPAGDPIFNSQALVPEQGCATWSKPGQV